MLGKRCFSSRQKLKAAGMTFDNRISDKSEAGLQVLISDFQVFWELANEGKRTYNIKHMYAYPKQEQAERLIPFQMICLEVKRGDEEKVKN